MSDQRSIRIIEAKSGGAYCDGGGGALGHPRIYLSLEGKTWVDCYYCGQRFATAEYNQKNY
ncbi:MAG: zinc-finger domain-containing protein [Gammaproteobacteria bacterium]|jgi:uncharacterized Zn-finger protein|nr:zinc-finger domain-containing protein [Thiotrichales bacterium]MAX28501.1 zinc-finger domain-containing protein [Thiotrichales bacterium]OUX50633.1 MAG: hypothetical protein CBE42_05860 [Methylococcaceae bacterium TMED282]|tara:strand:- start:218 stop:400 length:183 start_codon:yes stop_codon:yes gene_type:complete